METTQKQSLNYKKGGSFLIEDTKPEEVFTPEDFTEQHKMIADTTRDFADSEVMPNVDKIEEMNYDLVLKLLRKAGDIGLLSVDVPEEYGGLGLDKTSSMLVAENLGKTGSFAVSHGAHTGIGTLPIVYFGTEDQKKKYLPKFASGELISSYSLSEPGSGSDALSAKTVATPSPDGKSYMLNGTKMWLSNAGFADVYITFAQVGGDKFTSFILEKNYNGISLGKEEKKLGIKGSSTRALNLDNVPVPAENVIGEIGKGHRVALNILNVGRFKLGASVIGGAKAIITESIKYAKVRKQFQVPIISFGLIRHKLGEMAIRAFVGESMVYRTAGLIDSILQNVDKKSHDSAVLTLKGVEEYAVECSIIKVYASEILNYIADEGVQIFGGYGFTEEYPVARPYRDSRINRIFEGTNEINRLLIPSMLIRRAMKGELPLMAAAQKLMDEVISFSAGESTYEGLLADEMNLAANAKKIGLLVSGAAFQKYMDKLENEQEVIWHISDIVMEAYAMESVLLRVRKMHEKNGKDVGIYADIARAFVFDAIERVESHAKAALAIMAEGDMLRTYLTAVRRLLKYTPINSAYIRRAIVDKLAEADKYDL
ncbi:MAG: acyl-CoA dehydrogenase family protein [Bacteroidetes bacterium]|nr:acyl-CoA dehydrogenase family protein [Bacteroidota bacterium]MCL5739259.1 acyl-CoA dehydrogenase family protein [Bacteroidota bacterium]